MLKPCSCNEEVRAIRQRKLQQITGMTEAELDLRLPDLHGRNEDTQAMKDAAAEIVEDPYGILTVWGGAGNGKTLALQAIVNELRERYEMEGAYVLFSDLIDWVRAGFDDESEETERQRYEFIRSVPALAVDEVEKTRLTDYSDEFRFKFLDHRYRLATSGDAVTVLAMNCDPKELPYHIYSRLNDGRFQIVENQDSDVRPHLTR
jgi:DNA replication protein DnaC